MEDQEKKVARELHAAVCALACVCDSARSRDGHGFNKFDSQWGHALAQESPERWGLPFMRKVKRMLTKYREQLRGHGIDIEAIVVPERQTDMFRTARLDGNSVTLSWGYKDADFEVIKSLVKTFATWDVQARVWRTFIRNYRKVCDVCTRFGFSVSSDLRAAIDSAAMLDIQPSMKVNQNTAELLNKNLDLRPDVHPGAWAVLRFSEYDAQAVSDLKVFFTNREWLANERCWLVSVEAKCDKFLLVRFCQNWGFKISNELSDAIEVEGETFPAWVTDYGAGEEPKGEPEKDNDGVLCLGKAPARTDFLF